MRVTVAGIVASGVILGGVYLMPALALPRHTQPSSIDRALPDEVLGGEALWMRVRCMTEYAPVKNGYNVAQFARTRPGQPGPVFEVAARLREKESD
jgi:hypothetical protein